MTALAVRGAEDCFAAAKRRFDQDPEAWKGFTGTMEFVLTTEGAEPSVTHLVIEPGELRVVPGPAPGTPIGRVRMSEADFVLYSNGILDESTQHRRGLMHTEGDMYVLHKLPTLVVTDVPLYQFRTGDLA